MKLKDLTEYPTDYLDAYCEAKLGHTNWKFVDPESFKESGICTCVVFFNLPLSEEEHE